MIKQVNEEEEVEEEIKEREQVQVIQDIEEKEYE